MLRIREPQVESFEAVAQSAFVHSLTATLEQLIPEAVAALRKRSSSSQLKSTFEDFVVECVESAEQIEIDDDDDIAVFSAIVALAEIHAQSHPALFNFVYRALAREGTGRLRLAVIEDRLSEMAEQESDIQTIVEALAAVRERF